MGNERICNYQIEATANNGNSYRFIFTEAGEGVNFINLNYYNSGRSLAKSVIDRLINPTERHSEPKNVPLLAAELAQQLPGCVPEAEVDKEIEFNRTRAQEMDAIFSEWHAAGFATVLNASPLSVVAVSSSDEKSLDVVESSGDEKNPEEIASNNPGSRRWCCW